MKRYEEYKDTGVKWIPKIPKHWNIEPFGRHFTYGKGLPITKADLIQEGIPVISYGQIHSKLNRGTTISDELVRYVSPMYLSSNPNSLLKSGDFIFADTSEDIEGSGNFAYNDYETNLFAGYHTLIARPIDLVNTKYLAYLFLSKPWKNQVQSLVNGVKVYSIGKRHLKKSILLFPPLAEQEKIVRFLESKTLCIDAYVAERERVTVA
jgi:type I restriction enzyme S subunit